jgi:hypothetical protein
VFTNSGIFHSLCLKWEKKIEVLCSNCNHLRCFNICFDMESSQLLKLWFYTKEETNPRYHMIYRWFAVSMCPKMERCVSVEVRSRTSTNSLLWTQSKGEINEEKGYTAIFWILDLLTWHYLIFIICCKNLKDPSKSTNLPGQVSSGRVLAY